MELKQTSNVAAAANSARLELVPKNGEILPESKEYFDLLKPRISAVMIDPNDYTLEEFTAVVNHLPENVEPFVLDFIIRPLLQHLRINHRHKEDVRIILYKCTRIVLKKWQIQSFTLFLDLYQVLMISICKLDDPGNFDKNLAENIVELVISTILTLVEKSLSKHFQKLYSDKYIATVGHGVCILLQVVSLATLKLLRILAIHTVVLLIQICDGDADICHRIFKFLPGLATTFVRCCKIHGGRFQFDIIKESLEALKVCLITCISFERPEDLLAVDTNLSPGIFEFSDILISHPEKRLRNALAHFTISVIDQINPKLPKCSEVLWDNAFVFASDHEGKEREKWIALLQNPKNKNVILEMSKFKAIEHLLKKAVIQGNVKELNKCCLSAHKVASSLAVTRLSLDEVRIILPRIAELRGTCLRRHAESEDKHVLPEDRTITNCCLLMCQSILDTQDIEFVIGEFLMLTDRSSSFEDIACLRSSSGILLMNEVLSHLANSGIIDFHLVETISEKYITLLKPLPLLLDNLAEEMSHSKYMSESVKAAVITNSSATSMDKHVPNLMSGVCVHSSCVLKGFPVLAKLDPTVVHMLMFPLMEYAGLREPEYASVAETAMESLTTIASFSNLSLRTFLSINLDLVMSEFGARAEEVAGCPYMANALIFLANYFDFSQSHFLGFIEQILKLSTSKNMETKLHEVFTNIFYAYVLSMWKHYYDNVRKKQVADNEYVHDGLQTKSKPSTKSSLVDRLYEYQNALGIRVPHLDSSDEDNENSVNDIEERFGKVGMQGLSEDSAATEEYEYDGKKPLRPEVSLTLKVANKAAAYLTSPIRSIKLIAIEILIKAIQLLSPYEDELLPLLHTCWTTLAGRFEEKECIVLRKSFELLLTMVNFSGNFLQRRTIEGIFPIISIFLEELAEQSRNVESKNVTYFTYTQGYKLQLTILQGLAELCQAIEIGEQYLDKVVNTCTIYLSPHQHKKLREAAITLMVTLGHGPYGSSIWMTLVAKGIVQPPAHPTYPTFKPLPVDFTNRPIETSKPKKKIGRQSRK